MENFTTTFKMDFTIADHFGEKAIRGTFRHAFAQWRDDVRYLADLSNVLCSKIFEFDTVCPFISDIYAELLEKVDKWAYQHLKGDALAYYNEVTD